MDQDRMQAIAARDQLWASLRPLTPEIEVLAEGRLDGSERQMQLIVLLARIVAEELRFLAREANPEGPPYEGIPG